MKNRLYDATKIDWDNLMFSTKELWMLLIPIMVEQMLNSLMGMADTMMVSNVGSVAMSAVSLVDSINTLVIQVFAGKECRAENRVCEKIRCVTGKKI